MIFFTDTKLKMEDQVLVEKWAVIYPKPFVSNDDLFKSLEV